MAFETISLGTQPAGTGGDTARTAFEKVNRNFLAADVLAAAMSQAQFEAIRAQNNEEFAASGFVHFGKHWLGQPNINEGLYPYTTDPAFTNILFLGRSVTTAGLSKTNIPVLNAAGVLFYIQNLNTFNTSAENKIKFPQAPDGKVTYNKSTGAITNHSTVTAAFNAQAADPTNVEVVTGRVDMWGFEAWLEEVSTTNPYVYPNGLIQFQATTMDGITTSASARPVTYYAVFDGDSGSKGKGLNFFALTDAQKKKVLANPKNNLYYLDDGRLVQWRLRQRSFAGAGNGDWIAIDSTVNTSYGILPTTAAGSQLYRAQGNGDTPYSATSYWCPAGRNGVKVNWGWPNHTDIAIYQASKGNNGSAVNSVNGECYFLVCGTVHHGINQGLYHPSYNAGGAAKAVGDTFWYNTAASITSKADCFDSTKLLANSGSIASGKSGRPDGRFYDAIYADGQGGVCRDMRYSAYGVDAVGFAEADQRVKNGTYRGFEKTKLTTALSSVDSNVSIGGYFLVTEVIATDATINATTALSNGWSGFKNAQPPNGSVSIFELSRDAVSTPTALRSTNNGASWNVFTPTFNAANKSVILTNEPAANIVILQYQAFAKQTEIAPNAALAGLVPYNVFASSDYLPENGSILGESLIGKVLKNNTGVSVNNKALLSCSINSNGKLTSASNFDGVTHSPLTLSTPANNSPAFKAVSYLANINRQAVLHYAYTELKHNGTSFGDDGKVTIVDNQSTKTDLNGNTVLVGTAKLKEPIGWIKNNI